MFGTDFSAERLRDCLLSVPPVELKGMGLLAEQPHFISAPSRVPRALLVEAVTEIIAYTDRSAKMAQRLADLAPIPLLTVSIPEFGL